MPNILSLYRNAFSNLQPNVWILSFAMFINRAGSMVLLFTSLYLTRQLHFSIAEAGFVMSFYGAGSILGSYAGGWLTDRRNYFDVMVFALISCGCILLLLLITTNKFCIMGIIFSYAFTADMFRPANSTAIATFSTPENRTRSVSLMRLAVNLGFSVGPAVGGVVALHFGYKWLFVIDAFSGFGAAAMLFFYLPRYATGKNKHESTVLNDSSTSAYRDYTYLAFILLVAIYAICFFQLFASVPQYFNRVCKYDEDTIGLLLGLNGLLVVLIELPLISFIQNKKNAFFFIITGVLCIPVAFGILRWGQGMMIWSLTYTLFITMAEILSMPFMMNYAISRPPKERQGQYSALYAIGFGIGNAVAPALGLGIAGKYGFAVMFYFFISISILLAIGFRLLIWKREMATNQGLSS